MNISAQLAFCLLVQKDGNLVLPYTGHNMNGICAKTFCPQKMNVVQYGILSTAMSLYLILTSVITVT